MTRRASQSALCGALAFLLLWVCAQGAETRLGVGGCWGVTPTNFSLVGGAVRGELLSKGKSALVEGTILQDLRADDWVLYLDGALLLYFESSYLGVGMGWARWEDASGRDRGVWSHVYLKLLGGHNLTLFSLPVYVQVNVTLGEWSWPQPAVTVGIWF
ncbi:MAG: hypothetical protein NZ610_06290 [Candidatus Bipolaricaulota bacterium]|nr:hypothetical protein [Candidatus Bipolaricaulota bacterium]MDW8111580.1 hypothetical protein [Candidatus Bipolaricaulota bacterium]